MPPPLLCPDHAADAGLLDPAVAAHAWASGWAISRRTPAPVKRSGYLQISVGKPEQTTRFVLPCLERALLQQLVSEIGPGSWLKICAPLDRVSDLLPPPWDVHEP